MLDKQKIIDKLKAKSFEDNEYWVCSGAGLVMHGIKPETPDIDLGCSTKLADFLVQNGAQYSRLADGSRRLLIDGDIELFENWHVDKIIKIDGVCVASLGSIRKQKALLDREKDRLDIALIDKAADEHYMRRALELARKAAVINEVPIGCVIVHDNEIIGEGYNLRNKLGNTLYHAEIIAINRACRHLKDWRLENCTIYVNIEPCPMCAGAILQARTTRLVFGAANRKAGAVGSVLNLLDNPAFNHRVEVVEGVLADESTALMSGFFKKFRKPR